MKKFLLMLTVFVLLLSVVAFAACDPYKADYVESTEEQQTEFIEKLNKAETSYEPRTELTLSGNIMTQQFGQSSQNIKMDMTLIVDLSDEQLPLSYLNYKTESGDETVNMEAWLDMAAAKIYYIGTANVEGTQITQKKVLSGADLGSITGMPSAGISPDDMQEMIDTATVEALLSSEDTVLYAAGNKYKMETSLNIDGMPLEVVYYFVFENSGNYRCKIEMTIAETTINFVTVSGEFTAEIKTSKKKIKLPSDLDSFK